MNKIEKQKKKSSKLLRILAIAVVLVVVLVVVGKTTGTIGKTDDLKVAVAKVELQTITESVIANGKIQPEVEVKISSDVSGEITAMYVKEGDSVKAGQILARIDPELYESALDRSEASLNNAKANLANSKARLLQAEAKLIELEKSYKRNQQLHQQNLLSDAEFETITSTYVTAKAEVDASKQTVLAAQYSVQSMEAGMKEARKNLTRTEIFSPVNGVVSKLSVEKGERVVGTSQMAGTEMMRIANLNDMEVSVDVNENDIIKVSIGDTALVEVDSYGKRKFKGVVTEVANSATTSAQTTSDQVTNFVVKIRILRSSYLDLTKLYGSKRSVFRPGMSASVEVLTQTANNVVAIPIEAVAMRHASELDSSKTSGVKKKKNNAEETEVVFVVKNNEVKISKVSIGIQNDKFIHITGGLAAGQEVVIAPFSAISRTLKQGTKVQVVAKEELFEASEKP